MALIAFAAFLLTRAWMAWSTHTSITRLTGSRVPISPTTWRPHISTVGSGGVLVQRPMRRHVGSGGVLVQRPMRTFGLSASSGLLVKAYYTIRELSNHVDELWVLRSLGDEVIANGEGGGDPWVNEHLGSGYRACWQNPLSNGGFDSARHLPSAPKYGDGGLRFGTLRSPPRPTVGAL